MTLLNEGQRVEVAPYRGGRFFYDLAYLDGSRGVVKGLRGVNAYVDIERPPVEDKEIPRMALKLVGGK